VVDYLRPDSALTTAGVDPGEVTDVIVSHAHWDHIAISSATWRAEPRARPSTPRIGPQARRRSSA
jgi:glyoxylase-like metal-dependent hydrolase (beta-lactamase superfamily II)